MNQGSDVIHDPHPSLPIPLRLPLPDQKTIPPRKHQRLQCGEQIQFQERERVQIPFCQYH